MIRGKTHSFKNKKLDGIMGDKTHIVMEQVAMYMAALPCPPMPLMVTVEQDEDSDKRQTYCNSHDFIASLLLTAMAHGNEKLNEERKTKQIEMTDKLLKQMKELPKDNMVEKAYTHFSEFTAGYICAFANIDVGVTFLPLADVAMQDNVHRACCSWNRAQSIILKETVPADNSITTTNNKSYRELLQLHCDRFQSSGTALENI